MHVFVLEQQEYVAEELDWSVISFRDNQVGRVTFSRSRGNQLSPRSSTPHSLSMCLTVILCLVSPDSRSST